jgi:hypothetical protein
MTLVYCSANIIFIPFSVYEMQGLAAAELVHGNQHIILNFLVTGSWLTKVERDFED